MCNLSHQKGKAFTLTDARLTTEQTEAYCLLLGCSDIREADLETLNCLTTAHLYTVPFSSLDIYQAGAPPSLSSEALFEKVVQRRRGGYCFELNALFEQLLRTLGYQARPALARALVGRDRTPLNHRGILVALEGQDYYVDVGYGGPAALGALALQDKREQTVQGDVFRLRQKGQAQWLVERAQKETLPGQAQNASSSNKDKTGSPERHYRGEIEFYTVEVYDEDFQTLHVSRASAGSLFFEHKILNIRTEDGHYRLEDELLTLVKDGVTEQVALTDEEKFCFALEHYFGIAD